MDPLDLFFKKYSYKFPKGYPDLNDEQDINLLADLLEGLDINLGEAKKQPFQNLSSEAQEIGKEIMKALNIPEDEIKSDTKNRIVILTDVSRSEIFKKLEDLGYKRDVSISGSSAGGFIAPNGVQIIHKSKSLTSVGGAGIENENIFVDSINNYIEQSGNKMNIKITPTTGKTLEYKNITKAIPVGKEGEKKGWKGDAVLIDENNNRFAISIKKDGPFRWASVMKDFGDFYDTFMKKAYEGKISKLQLEPDPENPKVLQMINPDNNKPYGRIFITDVPQFKDENYLKKVIFGVDNAIIVQKTFSENDFSYDESSDILNIKVTKTITSLDEISEDELPILEFERNASKATSLEGYRGRGIVLRISPQDRALKSTTKANNLTLTYNEAIS